MLEKIPDGFQNLHFNTLTLSLTRVNWVERWSKVEIISLIKPAIWVSSVKDGKTQLRHAMAFRNV